MHNPTESFTARPTTGLSQAQRAAKQTVPPNEGLGVYALEALVSDEVGSSPSPAGWPKIVGVGDVTALHLILIFAGGPGGSGGGSAPEKGGVLGGGNPPGKGDEGQV